MWCSGTQFSGGANSAGFIVGLNDLTGFFQDKGFHDSMQTLHSGDEMSHFFPVSPAQALAC